MFLTFNPHAFIDNLYYMGFGMLGIFVVIGIIILITYLLNFIFSPKKKESKENTDTQTAQNKK